MADKLEVYQSALSGLAVRVLSLYDREDYSPTFGCGDRTFWAWKFVDFPGARFQEGLCYLSFLYATDFDGNKFYKSKKLLKWIAGGLDYWSNIQRSTGDFDEAYPFERSLAATSFTSFYLSEAWNFVSEDLPGDTANRFRKGLEMAGDWLIKNDETHGFLSNHLAAAAGALYHAYRITGHERFRERSSYFTNRILDHQSEEGWYDEYGGADPGYQTHGSFYLARIYQMSGDENLLESLERSFQFLEHFVHPDGSLGGEYTSRNTQTYYPAAFEMLSDKSSAASWIAAEMRPSVSSLAAAGLGTVDIYNLYPLLNNTVFAYLGCLKNTDSAAKPEGPSSEPGNLHFPNAGLLKVRRQRYDLFIGIHKGGVFKLFDRKNQKLVVSNCGYIGKLSNGKTFSNQWNDPDRMADVSDDAISIEGEFYQSARPVMDPYRFLAFRVFSLTLGRFKKAAYWIKGLLVKVLIYEKKSLNIRFSRKIQLLEDGIEVTDFLQGEDNSVVSLEAGETFTTIHMGSSRYFVPHETTDPPPDDFWRPIDVGDLKSGVHRTIKFRLEGDTG